MGRKPSPAKLAGVAILGALTLASLLLAAWTDEHHEWVVASVPAQRLGDACTQPTECTYWTRLDGADVALAVIPRINAALIQSGYTDLRIQSAWSFPADVVMVYPSAENVETALRRGVVESPLYAATSTQSLDIRLPAHQAAAGERVAAACARTMLVHDLAPQAGEQDCFGQEFNESSLVLAQDLLAERLEAGVLIWQFPEGTDESRFEATVLVVAQDPSAARGADILRAVAVALFVAALVVAFLPGRRPGTAMDPAAEGLEGILASAHAQARQLRATLTSVVALAAGSLLLIGAAISLAYFVPDNVAGTVLALFILGVMGWVAFAAMLAVASVRAARRGDARARHVAADQERFLKGE